VPYSGQRGLGPARLLYKRPDHPITTLVNFQLDALNSVGDCPVHRLTGAQDSHLQRVTILDAALIQLDHLKTSSVLLETCRGF